MVSSAVSNKRFMLLAEKLRTFGYEVKGDYPSPLLFRIFAAIILITLGAVGAMALFGFVIYFLRTFL